MTKVEIGPAAAAVIGRGFKTLTAAERDAAEHGDCTTCGRTREQAGTLSLVMGGPGAASQWTVTGVECVPCWNAGVARRDAERKAQLAADRAARPMCEACTTRRSGYILMTGTKQPVYMCRACQRRCRWNLRSHMLFPVSVAGITRAQLIRRATTGETPPKGWRG